MRKFLLRDIVTKQYFFFPQEFFSCSKEKKSFYEKKNV